MYKPCSLILTYYDICRQFNQNPRLCSSQSGLGDTPSCSYLTVVNLRSVAYTKGLILRLNPFQYLVTGCGSHLPLRINPCTSQVWSPACVSVYSKGLNLRLAQVGLPVYVVTVVQSQPGHQLLAGMHTYGSHSACAVCFSLCTQPRITTPPAGL